jgi:aspartyl/glutamyl-tRNA(Asn/Gln) amidotransferase C subunit
MRDDEQNARIDREEALSNAPDAEDGLVRVPNVIE